MNPQPNPELLAELKAYVFAMYIGQKVLMLENYLKPTDVNIESMRYVKNDCHLYLRPLSGITDQESIEVAGIVCARHNRHYKPNEVSYSMKRKGEVFLEVKGHKAFVVQIHYDGIGFVNSKVQGYGEQHYFAPAQYAATDCIRGFGIALPIYYKGVQYSVEQLVELGIITLKS